MQREEKKIRMRHRFVRTIVALGIIGMSTGAVIAGNPADAAGRSPGSSFDTASTASLPDASWWGALLGIGVATAGAMAVAQRRQHAFDARQRATQPTR